MKKLLLLLVLSSITLATEAQFTRYLVKFKNKANNSFTLSNPLQFLSQRALDRRQRYGIALDSADLPVTQSYLGQVAAVPNVIILNASRWLNQVSIQTTDANAIVAINAMPFVESVSGIAARQQNNQRNKYEDELIPYQPSARTAQVAENFFDYGSTSLNEIKLHNGEFLHNIGLRGQGIHIAMLDAGFFNYTGLRAFDSVNANGQVLSTWDFVARHASVTEDNSHGMQCFSTIAANIPGQFIGKAPKASFHLFRTEEAATEYPIEEHNWVCGAERADSAGSDLISSSVGYYDFDNAAFNYTYNDMNGRTTIISRGAVIAARKGLLVFNANGNEGNNSWKFLIAPADVDSIVAVGAVNSSGNVGGFSSYGPSADGRIKPDVASVGVAALIQGSSNTLFTSNGTSFAGPNMAGLAACLWQGFQEFNNIRIITALRQAGHIAHAPDDRTGYGIPDMKKAFSSLLAEYATVSSSVNACQVTVNWNSKDVDAMRYEIERKLPGETNYSKVGDVNAASGKILANRSYQFNNTLLNVNAGTVSYRIRQIIDTTAATFTAVYIDSTEVIIAGCFPTSTNDPAPAIDKFFVQPNPVQGNNTATLVVETNYAIPQMRVIVHDMKGSRLLQLSSSKTSGRKIMELPVGKLPAGQYHISIYNGLQLAGRTTMIRL